MKIGDREIGPGHPVYVIAEAGVNHDGDVEKALCLCEVASEAGADAVKFQAFHADELAGPEAKQATYQAANSGRSESQRTMLERLELTALQFADIMKHCVDVDVEFLASPFSGSTLNDLEFFGTELDHRMPAVKVASQQIVDLPMLADFAPTWRQVAREPVPVLLSTGAATMALIDQAVRLLRSDGLEDLILLHCVASYPTPWDRQNLLAIRALAKAFDLPVGYSDHSVEVESGELAVACGACVLEKHFTLSREEKGPDHAVSLLPGELSEYVKRAKGFGGVPEITSQIPQHLQTSGDRDALGLEAKVPQDIELESRDVSRKTLAALREIPAGTVIDSPQKIRDHLTTLPRGSGDPATNAHLLWGREFAQDVPKGEIIQRDMLSGDAE